MFEKSHRKSTYNLQLAFEDCALPVSVELHLFYVGSSIQNASEKFLSCIHLSFVNSALHPTPRTKIKWVLVWRFKQPYLGNHSELDTCSINIFIAQ